MHSRRLVRRQRTPPSKFSNWVLAFASECPSRGKYYKRKTYDWAKEREEKKNSTRTKTGVKLVKMHKERAVRHFTDVLDMAPEDALSLWEKYVENTKEKDTDQQGPRHSRLRCPIPVEDYIMGENETEHSKALMLESAPKRLKKIEDLAEMEARVETGHASLTDDLNNKTGASALRTIQDLGGSSTLSSGGAFSGSEKVASLTDVTDFVNNDDSQPVTKKKRGTRSKSSGRRSHRRSWSLQER